MNHLKEILNKYYRLQPASITEQQGGWATLAYKVNTEDGTFFLKVYEKSRVSTKTLAAGIDDYVPLTIWLHEAGGLSERISVPIRTATGDHKCEDETGIYLLYPYIVGETIGNRDLSHGQVEQLADLLAKLHSYDKQLPILAEKMIEDFHVPFIDPLVSMIAKESVEGIVLPYRHSILNAINEVMELAAKLKHGEISLRLCHTDLHEWNMMQSGERLILVDWEGLKLCPVEADMMFFIDKPYFRQLLSRYRKSHHDYEINETALAFYQKRRKLEDIWEFLQELQCDQPTGEKKEQTTQYLLTELKNL
ncbi:aminoglycoside phosphotransferase family protein [Bacillus sp. CRN 9]|nr:aminoglycoside phosphotransferase family protein [Bacillus sp. CRN 9]